MSAITREQLHAYLDDALSDVETARVEQALRQSEPLRRQLQKAMDERDRGDHSLGAIWRREGLTCPKRETLNSYLLEVLDDTLQDYITFHLETVGCPSCKANLDDLQAQKQEPPQQARARHKKIFHSTAGSLHTARDGG